MSSNKDKLDLTPQVNLAQMKTVNFNLDLNPASKSLLNFSNKATSQFEEEEEDDEDNE